VEGLDSVVRQELQRRELRVRGQGSWPDVGGGERLLEDAAAVVVSDIGVRDGVPRQETVTAGGGVVDNGGREPGAQVPVTVEADLDVGAGRQEWWRRRGRGARRLEISPSAPAAPAAAAAIGERRPAGDRPAAMWFWVANAKRVW
jgi:hypothetical protein